MTEFPETTHKVQQTLAHVLVLLELEDVFNEQVVERLIGEVDCQNETQSGFAQQTRASQTCQAIMASTP